MHQCFLSPAIDTILHAVQNHQLENILFMKSKLVQKHLAKSPATSKGHMKCPRAGIRSTRSKWNTSKIQVLEPTSLIHPNAQHSTPETVPTRYLMRRTKCQILFVLQHSSTNKTVLSTRMQQELYQLWASMGINTTSLPTIMIQIIFLQYQSRMWRSPL